MVPPRPDGPDRDSDAAVSEPMVRHNITDATDSGARCFRRRRSGSASSSEVDEEPGRRSCEVDPGEKARATPRQCKASKGSRSRR